ncbi:MAG: fructosamine kinase family protein [Actinomycetota bacterium]|nr:fructosamine kinase family protein [Actinomycetota bacterium]
MARMGGIAGRVEALLGTAVVATTPVAGGDVCNAARVRLSDGRNAFVKTRPHAPADFFAVEAAGLRWLAAAADGARVPAVLAQSADCLVLSWVEAGRPSADIVEGFARRLATPHASGAPCFGADSPGYIGVAPLANTPADSWPEFYATRRVVPYLRVARDRGAIAPADATAVDEVVERITAFAGPPEPPSRLHGDLWSGNVVWSSDGHGVLVDPAAHGGHRETDLAMLTLFGAPHLARLIDAYDEAYPLGDGWRDRVPLHQLHPLLVHAAVFGGSYGSRAGDAARTLLAAREVAS